MKIGIVYFGIGFNGYSIRLLSSILKRDNHSISLFYPFPFGETHENMFYKVNEDKLNALKFHLNDKDIILFSISTSYFFKQAYHYKEFLSNNNKPILWGGSHCIAAPDESLSHNDIICSGEAELCLPEFIGKLNKTGEVPTDVKGMWVMKEGRAYKNGFPSPVIELDTLPYPDYNFENDFIWKDRDFIKLKDTSKINAIYFICTRGCIFKCSYCLHSRMNFGIKGIRRHSVKYIIDLLKYYQRKFPYMVTFGSADSDFFLLPQKYLEQFSKEYKANINARLSFSCSPASWNEEKARHIMDTGLVSQVAVGVQGASQKMKQYFNRKMDKNERIIEISKFNKKYYKKYGTLSLYHLIWDTPLDDKSDYIANAHLMNQMDKPFELRNHSLSVLPGTKIFNDYVTNEKKALLFSHNIDDIMAFYLDQYAGGDISKRSPLAKHFVSICNIASRIRLPGWFLKYLIKNHNDTFLNFLEKTAKKSYTWQNNIRKVFYLIKQRKIKYVVFFARDRLIRYLSF